MIVYVPALRGGTFIDCTDKASNLMDIIPLGLAKKEALLLDDRKPRLVAIPENSPESNSIAITREAEIVLQADASVHEKIEMRGTSASALRSFFRNTESGNRKTLLQQQLAQGGQSLAIQDLNIGNLDDAGKPLLLEVNYVIKGRFHSVGNQLIGRLPAVWERLYLASESVEKRQSPFSLRYPMTLQSRLTLKLPAGFVSSEIKPAEIKTEFGQCALSPTEQPGVLNVDSKVRQSAGEFKPAQYEAYHETFNRILDSLEQNVVLTGN